MKKQRMTSEVLLQASEFKILTLKSIEKIWRYCAIIQETLALTALSAVSKALQNGDTESFNNFKAITCLVFKNNSFICKLLGWGRGKDRYAIYLIKIKTFKDAYFQLGKGVTDSDLLIWFLDTWVKTDQSLTVCLTNNFWAQNLSS